jgi:Glycosyl transferase family 2
MKLSVVIPCYNVARYAEAAVMSALNQTLRDIEVIVINDGSTDDTRDVLRAIETLSDPRLKIIDQPNGGLAAARNTGIKAATGEFIAFLDGDDLWYPNKAERQLTIMNADLTIGLTYTGVEIFGDVMGSIVPKIVEHTLYDVINFCQICASGVIVQHECFRIAGLFNEQLVHAEDWEMWCRIIHGTHLRAVLVPEVLVAYRVRSSGLMHDFAGYGPGVNAAVASLRRLMPEVPSYVFREGHGEHYRTITWTAATSGHRLWATRYLAAAIRYYCPWSIWKKWRTIVGLIAAIVLPAVIFSKIQRQRGRAFAATD